MSLPPEAWPRLKEVFEGARALALDDRPAYVAAACHGDEALREAVEKLLASHEQAASFLETPAVLFDDTLPRKSLEGQRIGSYQLLARIGTGGMGEVYRARDTKLDRHVAIKLLLPAVADDPDRLARFSREAQLLAALNHPHIAQIHGLEDAGGLRALVMELVEGPTLADRIARGPIPIDEALSIARQIAEALEAAHERGIVHRDLKPANIKVREDGTVKVLDFGLAKALDPASGDGVEGPSPVPPGAPATEAGLILGTAAYMSPEQVRGRSVDRRADIWAFGVVVYEMLSGTRPHGGDSLQETIASVLRDEPGWDKVPSQAHRLLKRCLEKNPSQRLRHIGDAMALLDAAPSGPYSATATGAPNPGKRWLSPAVAAALVLLAVVGIAIWAPWRSNRSSGRPVRFEVGPAEKMTYFSNAMAVSPDGRWIVFPARGEDGVTRFWLRSLETVEARPLPGTETIAVTPPASWSWDSRYVIFSARNKLTKIDTQGGPPQTLADVPGYLHGAAWNRDGVIVAGMSPDGPLLRLSASGGVPVPATVLEKGETTHRWPQFLPDGRHFLYQRASADPNKMGVYIGSIDARPEDQSLERLLASNRQAYYAASPHGGLGHLVFMRETTLMAQRFDPASVALSGEPAAIAEGVDSFVPANAGLFSVSQTGTLVYLAGRASRMALTWFDQQGHPGGTLGEPGEYANPAMSPDGTRVAVALGPAANRDIWIVDVARATATRFTFDRARDDYPVWSPDGKSIVFSSERSGRVDLYTKPADASAEERLLFSSDEPKSPSSLTKDGRYLIFSSNGTNTGSDLWALPMQGEARPIAILQTPFAESMGHVSPDGRWIAYSSREAGTWEIYVRPFSPEAGAGASGAKWLVSKGSGLFPRWRADGRALFYTSLDLEQMAVDIDLSKGFQAGTPRRLFAAPPPLLNVGWDLAPDGKRYLFITEPGGSHTVPFTVVVNWEAGLRE